MHRPGDIIDERYQLTRPLGIRAGAEVWEAEHEVVGRKVTLKILPVTWASTLPCSNGSSAKLGPRPR